MSAQKLRVGIIGIGFFGLESHIPNLQKLDTVEIVAISRRNAERLALAKNITQVDKAYTDWREMLAKETLDAVIISTPHHAHVEPTLAALERKLHVLLEKPMALTSKDASLIVSRAEQAGRVLTVGYNSRGLGGWRAIKNILAANTLGQLRQVNVVSCMDSRVLLGGLSATPRWVDEWLATSGPLEPFINDLFAHNNWRSDPHQMGGGMFIDCGTHTLDMMLWLCEGTPIEVIAYTDGTEQSAENFVTCQGRLSNAMSFSATFNNAVSGGDVALYGSGRLTIFGDKGLLTADWTSYMATNPTEIWLEHDGIREKVESLADTITPVDGFVATILKDAPNFAPAHEAAQVVALTEAVYRSAKEKRVIRIETL